MLRGMLTYMYLFVGFPLAVLLDHASYREARRRADTDGDGEADRSVSAVKHSEERRLRRDPNSRARPPREAAQHRASEIFDRPLRTLGLILVYEVPLLAVAACVTYTDAVAELGGSDVGALAEAVSAAVTPQVPAWLVPLLPAVATVAGLVLALVVHQSYKTSGDIRRQMA